VRWGVSGSGEPVHGGSGAGASRFPPLRLTLRLPRSLPPRGGRAEVRVGRCISRQSFSPSWVTTGWSHRSRPRPGGAENPSLTRAYRRAHSPFTVHLLEPPGRPRPRRRGPSPSRRRKATRSTLGLSAAPPARRAEFGSRWPSGFSAMTQGRAGPVGVRAGRCGGRAG
jgi:hypothetical protein